MLTEKITFYILLKGGDRMSILQKVKQIAISSESFNNTDGWGRFGSVGNMYVLPNGAKLRIYKYHYAHGKSDLSYVLYDIDESESTSKTYIERYLTKFRETCKLRKLTERRIPKPVVITKRRSYTRRRHNNNYDQLTLKFG